MSSASPEYLLGEVNVDADATPGKKLKRAPRRQRCGKCEGRLGF